MYAPRLAARAAMNEQANAAVIGLTQILIIEGIDVYLDSQPISCVLSHIHTSSVETIRL